MAAKKGKKSTKHRRRGNSGIFVAVEGRTVVAGHVTLRVTNAKILSKVLHFNARDDNTKQAKLAFVARNDKDFVRILAGPYNDDD